MSSFKKSIASIAALAPFLAGCAGSTVNSGVGDRFFSRSPYYAGRFEPRDTVRMAWLPIRYQQGATQPAIFDPAAGENTPVDDLLSEMNAFLASLRVGESLSLPPGTRGSPPDVQFGCTGGDDCDGFDAMGPGDAGRMRLAIAKPSGDWVDAARGAMERANANRAVLITLEITQMWPRQRNWRGSKEVELGTNHTMDLPWLTALDRPVHVIQVTGAVLRPDGTAVRIGAEGMLARRTNLLTGAFGVQRQISNEDVEALRTARRDDLAGAPLVWQEAIRQLVGGLTGAEVRLP
jgi:hypothetical protein